MTRDERKVLYSALKNAEDRAQRKSALVPAVSRLVGIPVPVLMHEDLTCETVESLRERFGFDPAAVERRAGDFKY
ncbi:hypothetical protein BG60_29110 [Caballeronia zhejiangensis]|uniref:Uncharacterized protein n=2 Tax=Burkholderiaceae TaxID=119060 RepID=A0A656QNM3_9BURK|nr:hypothetical protein BG60_29110 [Caballeronia zhejiangensis]